MSKKFNLAEWLTTYDKIKHIRGTDPQKSARFWCSDIYSCPRKVYYRLHNFPAVEGKGGVGALEEGILREELLIQKMKESGLKVIAEQKEILYDFGDLGLKLPLKGKIDAIIEDPNGKIWIIEIKTTSAWSFKKLKNEGKSSRYLYQIYPYLIYEQKDGKILIQNRENNELMEMEVTQKEALENFYKVITHLNIIADMVATYKLPEAKPMEKWECNYCKYKFYCATNENTPPEE